MIYDFLYIYTQLLIYTGYDLNLYIYINCMKLPLFTRQEDGEKHHISPGEAQLDQGPLRELVMYFTPKSRRNCRFSSHHIYTISYVCWRHSMVNHT